ncbi:PAS domain-containing protein [Halomonas rhizosphaerae]|uniref:PAS domain-containing protein n=1 Tax=Halomonas rhizosphaerae TaxID=3043296 RepID=A0ABT6V166_9GAMM|nr:PAS domain-containing protein [Halomonas rhizosphaerae]MDI5891545.1 PAS domain-containing protein [Halomonas rhizosphaerae]
MPTTSNESSVYTQLRDKAEAQLQMGTTPTASHWSVGVDALSLLHRLSSNPDNAEDALKLLHELQVHQVELDLQNEEVAANEQALGEELSLYRNSYDSAPFGYFLVDLEGKVIQVNLAGTELFGVGRDDLEGHPIDTCLPAESRPQLRGLLQHVAKSGARDSCVAKTGGGAQGSRHLQFLASIPPGREHILLACCECASGE